MAAAVEYWGQNQQAHAAHLTELRGYLIEQIRQAVPDAILNGAEPSASKVSGPELRLPANAHFSFPGCEGDALLMLLDAVGVECSTGSACNAGIPEPSHVLLRMGLEDEIARSSLRFSLGSTSTRADIDKLVAALPEAVARASKAKANTGQLKS
jgi:cysteine desulfurase